MKEIKGSCLCSGVHYEAKVEPKAFYLCHCSYCRKDTGSAHGANIFAVVEDFKWKSGDELVNIFNLKGTKHSRSFCKTCGSALPLLIAEGKMLQIPAGSIDGDVDFSPIGHLFKSSKADWDDNLQDIRWFENLPE